MQSTGCQRGCAKTKWSPHNDLDPFPEDCVAPSPHQKMCEGCPSNASILFGPWKTSSRTGMSDALPSISTYRPSATCTSIRPVITSTAERTLGLLAGSRAKSFHCTQSSVGASRLIPCSMSAASADTERRPKLRMGAVLAIWIPYLAHACFTTASLSPMRKTLGLTAGKHDAGVSTLSANNAGRSVATTPKLSRCSVSTTPGLPNCSVSTTLG